MSINLSDHNGPAWKGLDADRWTFDQDNTIRFRGMSIRWSGWFQDPNAPVVRAYWIAWKTGAGAGELSFAVPCGSATHRLGVSRIRDGEIIPGVGGVPVIQVHATDGGVLKRACSEALSLLLNTLQVAEGWTDEVRVDAGATIRQWLGHKDRIAQGKELEDAAKAFMRGHAIPTPESAVVQTGAASYPDPHRAHQEKCPRCKRLAFRLGEDECWWCQLPRENL